ncbi:MAG: Mn-dependent transcriptional regulator, partial [Desulfurococcaceae archaeon]
YSYAQAKLGGLLDKIIAENKLVRVGSLVVDAQFFSEFNSKFPIKVSDLDKLTSHERVLLEEMRKEALVILHAGREYRLID